MILGLKSQITYGPVKSRRLGYSLGINLFPGKVKVCSFDCVYCQYGWTGEYFYQDISEERLKLPTVDEVEQAVGETLQQLVTENRTPAYLTFSGNGEPTIHPRFPGMVEVVRQIRDRIAPAVKTAILSNSSTVNSEIIQQALLGLDVRIMKFDCGSVDVFRSFNKPAPGITVDLIASGLTELGQKAPLVIQTMFAAGEPGNLNQVSIDEWVTRLKQIAPSQVQIYTLARGFPEARLVPATLEEMQDIAALLESVGIDAVVF
jgi:wyosine [tRNA(Phe)-imidazoG37] synthetase (radical SAM superfamily)